ncbi:MAG: GNAT family N-acetyltransferase, partial [Chloroflexi bacterium]|nr:GNAT family N-acetyltransferase [Chloroflexota bacterium]
GAGKEQHLLAIADDDVLVGIVPLVQDGDTISFSGGVDVSDYLDFLYAPEYREFVFGQVFSYLRRSGCRQADFHCLPAASPTAEHFPGAAAFAGFRVLTRNEDTCPILPLPETWDEFLGLLSKKDRHELRRKLRRLEGAGQFRIVCSDRDGDPEGLAQDMTDFFRLHRLSREEKAVFMDEKMEGFFRAIAAHFVPLGVMKIFFMELDGVRVASAICFDWQNNLYLYNSGYDHAYSNLSVGLLLKALCIREAITSGKVIFDFLRGDEPYKYDLGGKDIPIYHCQLTR